MDSEHAARPGQLTPTWRGITLVNWALVFVAWSGAWKVSRELGIAAWWLGPETASRSIVVMLLPFAPAAVMIVLTLLNARWLPFGGLVASAIGAAIGVVDLGYVRRLGVVEIAIAAAAAAVSLASLSGMYRSVSADAPVVGDSAATDSPLPDR